MDLSIFAHVGSRWQDMIELQAVVVIDSLPEDTCPVLIAVVCKNFETAETSCTSKDYTSAPSCKMSPVYR